MVKVLLFSGGLDSFCLNHLIKPNIRIYFDLGTEDGKKELENIKKIPFKVKIIKLPLKEFELPNKIIPHRNSIFVLLASNFGNEIYLGATKGDTTKDKDYVFKAQMEEILNYFGTDKNKVKTKEYPYRVNLPLKEMTKTEVVRKYIEKGGSIKELLKYSRSCYKGKEKECGKCRSCLRKAIALELNNINTNNLFEENPFNKISSEIHKKMFLREGEREDYLKIIAKYKPKIL